MSSPYQVGIICFISFATLISAQNTCINQNDTLCASYTGKNPEYCYSTDKFINGQLFSVYCAKACNINCNNNNNNNNICTNTVESICSFFGKKYCTNNSYFSGQLFKSFCPKLCNQCSTIHVCTNQNDEMCNFYGAAYCTTYSYIKDKLFTEYCQKVCNTC